MTRRRKLLLADDSPTIQKVISLTFADEGMEVVTASGGGEALRLLEAEPRPDLIIADVVMPGPDGYELCERVRSDERLRHIPVVLLVGAFEPFNEAEARRVGADTVLTKPFQSIRDLVSKVGSLLGGESKPEENAPAPHAAEGHRELAEEVLTRPPERAADAARPAADAAPPRELFADEPSAPATSSDEPAPRAEETFSFADFGSDDEMIEARPADSLGGAQPRADTPAARHQSPPPPAPFDEADPFGFGEETMPARGAAQTHARESSGFAAQAAGMAAADDALLDLGRIEPPTSGGAADADEFVLDLDDDFAAPPAPAASPFTFDDLLETPVDNAGAFAEAAHGGPALEDVAESPVASPSVGESEAERTPFEFSALPAEAEAFDPELTREVPRLDVPPFVGGGAADARGAVGEAIEPEVVPAAEPVPGTFESEFTDGSVEGDLPRPAPFIPETPATPGPAFPEPPSAAGYALGEARTGFDERPGAGRLSPEEIEAIARRVVELMSEKVVREVAWEVVPDLAELLIKRRLDEKEKEAGG